VFHACRLICTISLSSYRTPLYNVKLTRSLVITEVN
jgi:hypothetical protein